MKKILCVVACLMLAVLSACGTKDVRFMDEKKFTKEEMTITLTKGFKETEMAGYTACYDSNKVAVFVLREAKSDFAEIEDMSLLDYAELVRKANSSRLPSEVGFDRSGFYFEYSAYNSEEGKTYKYYTTLHESKEAFWLVQFAASTEDYTECKEFMIKCATSVVMNG